MDLAYVGSKGTHIYRTVDGNPPDPTLVNQLVAFCSDPTNALGCNPGTVTYQTYTRDRTTVSSLSTP